MRRLIRMRKYNPKSSSSSKFDYLFPQAVTENIMRSDDGGILETDLNGYDRHLENTTVHMNRALSTGTERALSVQLDKTVLVDGFPLLITLHTSLECEPTLSFNGGDAYPIVAASGDRIPGGQEAGSVIFVVWNARDSKWVLLSADNFNDITKIVLPVESEYTYKALANGETTIVIPNFNKKTDKLSLNYGQTILRYGMEYEFLATALNTVVLKGFSMDKDDIMYCTITTFITTAKRGHYKYELKSTEYQSVAAADGTTSFPIPSAATSAFSMSVNYEQTILRNNLDYTINDSKDTLTLTNFSLKKDEQLVFTITEFVEAPGDFVPNNWGATGNYRYSFNVIHTSYKATEDDISVIAVPGYNFKKDDISVVKNNLLYIYDVDYTIDEIGNVVLLKTKLNTDEEIYFTIMQGAMMDVPDFNVIKATGYDGQHILVDISYTTISDYYVLLIKLNNDLLSAPTIKCVDGPAESIVDCFHTPIQGGYKAGSYLWVVYSQDEHLWYSLSHSQLDISTLIPQYTSNTGTGHFSGVDPDTRAYLETTIAHGLGVKPSRITITPNEPPTAGTTIGDIWSSADATNIYVGNSGGSLSGFNWVASNEEVTNDLRSYIDQEIISMKATPGKITTHISTYTADADGIDVISNIDSYRPNVDKIIVNFNQTVLREGVDFRPSYDNNGIRMVSFTLKTGDILQFIVLEQSAV